MQNSKKGLLGMTLAQLVVLICLGLTAAALIFVAGSLFLGKTAWLGIQQTEPTQAELAMETALPPTETSIPSETSQLPISTFTATVTEPLIPSGWKQLISGNASFWAPPSFDKDLTGKSLINLKDTKNSTNGFHANIILSKDTGIMDDLDKYAQDSIKQFSQDTTFLEMKDFPIGSLPGKRLKVEVIVSTIPIETAVYLIKYGDTVWVLTCGSYFDDFHTWQPIFDNIARTFTISQ